MFLRRLGNKTKLAKKIIQTFPFHNVYIEPFFGAGGLFFNKPLVNHNFLNDIDDDVFNLWVCFTKRFNELYEAIQSLPQSESIFNYWLENKETEPIQKAVRFIFLSNFSLYGVSNTFYKGTVNAKEVLISNFINAKYMLKNTNISNCDFRKLYSGISIKSEMNGDRNSFTVLSYNDPPYLGTNDNYSHSFTEQDSIDLFDINCNLAKQYPAKYFFAISEFNHPFILEQAKERNLNVIEIGERRTMKNRNTEILVCNYEVELGLFDSLGGTCNKEKSLAFA